MSAFSYVMIVILVALSAFFSGSETAFATVNKIRMKNLAAEGNKKAEKVLYISENYDRALSAILIGNNIVNIGTASIATVICTFWFQSNGAWVATLLSTIVVLIFGEVLPKSMAKENADRVCLAVVDILSVLMKILTPAIFFFVKLKSLVSRNHGDKQPTVTEQELKYIIEESENEGVLEEQESELVQSALDFDEITVDEILTPRVDVVAVSEDEDVEVVKELFLNDPYSRLPVYKGTIDTIVGIIHSKDFFRAYSKDPNVNLRTLVQKPLFVPPKKRISELLKELQKLKTHMAIVTDQYGGTIGVITLEDILEELVGDIWDESDQEEVDVVQLSENRYEVSGDVNLEDFFDDIDYEYRESDFEDTANTFAGWALETFERIPEKGDSFTYRDLKITVLEVSEQRILKLEVELLSQKTVSDTDS
ncbi:MAG: hemolysin family protein [Massiliimalia sp.]